MINNEKLQTLSEQLVAKYGTEVSCIKNFNELTVEIKAKDLLKVLTDLRDDPNFSFSQLIDLAGVDYCHYGRSQWPTQESTSTGFSRSVLELDDCQATWEKPRYAVVYHLLSLKHNLRLRCRCFPEGEPPILDSIVEIYSSANWYEREAFDLYGILFNGHPDLRRILTDYGFIGHPFRKDFPLIGEVELRYDQTEQRTVYEPVSIEDRTLVPKVIRKESEYFNG